MLSLRDIRDLSLLVAIAAAAGLANIAVRGDLPLIAGPPDPEETSCGVDELTSELIVRLPVTEARALVGREDVTFVDARSLEAYVQAHVPGSVSLPASDAAGVLEIQSVPIPPENLVITYCDGLACEQSEYLGLLLRDRAGCEQVQVLDGGWNAWLASGAPTSEGHE